MANDDVPLPTYSINLMMSKQCLITLLFQFKSKTYTTFRHFQQVFRIQNMLDSVCSMYIQLDPRSILFR